MRRLIILFLFLSLFDSVSYSQNNLPTDSSQVDIRKILEPVLKGDLLTANDLSLRDDYLKKDSMRIALIDSFMADPFYMQSFGPQMYKRLAEDPRLWDLIKFASDKLLPLSKPHHLGERFRGILVPNEKPSEKAKPQKVIKLEIDLSGLDENLRIGINNIINAAFNAQNVYDDAFDEVDRDSLIYGFTLLLMGDENDDKKSVEELDSLGQYGEEWTKALVDILPKFDLGIMINGAEMLSAAVDDYLSAGQGYYFGDENTDKPIEISSPLGKIAIGTVDRDHYSGEYLLIIDPGGDDNYYLTAGRRNDITVIIDYNGNDTYHLVNDSLYTFTENAKILNRYPPGIGGYKYIVDYQGNDIYYGNDFSLAAGIFGVSILKDYEGDDNYITDTFGPAAGAMGIGILMDFHGRDTYNGAMYNEGFGFTGGIGILFDGEGEDNYLSGGKYGDILRYVDHYITFSQGSAYGIRPYFSGGIGALLDGFGNDLYVSDIFGQASGYWYSAGIIYDGSGNDRYQSFQYAQGCGTHMAVGCLRDDSGDDTYFSKGVSQGCGHDYAQGWLLDYSGGDVYSAYDLSQGAGSANGIGAIIDIKGDDRYYVKSDKNTQGYGNPRRSYGSIGIFYDGAGEDRYEGGPGADNHIWLRSKWGIGWDNPDSIVVKGDSK